MDNVMSFITAPRMLTLTSRLLMYVAMLLLCLSLPAFADGEGTYLTESQASSQTTPSDNQTTSQVTTSVTPRNDADIQNLATFLAQNPGVANQVSDILNGQTPATTTASRNSNENDTAQTTDKTTSMTPWNSSDKATQDTRDTSFSAIANQAFPLSPDQIKALNSMMDATQRAQAAAPNDSPPQPTSTSLFVNLAPGTTPPVIRLSHGFVSSLVFIDSTGASWPIEAYDIGNPTAFNITWDKKGNTLMVQARAAYTYGNLAVKLIGLNTPVMLTLVPGQKIVDYRVDLRIQGIGPNAKPDAINSMGLPEQADTTLLNVLDGVPPDGAKRLSVSSNVVQVWVVDDKRMYVRTAFTLLSPAWISKMSSADGMNAYQLQVTPMLLLSRYGKVQQIKVEGL